MCNTHTHTVTDTHTRSHPHRYSQSHTYITLTVSHAHSLSHTLLQFVIPSVTGAISVTYLWNGVFAKSCIFLVEQMNLQYFYDNIWSAYWCCSCASNFSRLAYNIRAWLYWNLIFINSLPHYSNIILIAYNNKTGLLFLWLIITICCDLLHVQI